jgi:hypothetical protein
VIDWLYSLPDWLLLVAWATLLAGLIVVLPRASRRVAWLRPNAERTDFVLRLQATLFTATSFVIAFTLVEAESNFRKVDALTQDAFAGVSRGVLALEPSQGRQVTIYAEILRSFDSVAEARDSRLNAVTVSLSAVFWEAIGFAVLMLLFVSSNIEQTRFRSVILACQMAVLGAFIGFVFVMDQPFKGRSGVDPGVIVQTIAIMENRKSG